jgi:hypothetical protein
MPDIQLRKNNTDPEDSPAVCQYADQFISDLLTVHATTLHQTWNDQCAYRYQYNFSIHFIVNVNAAFTLGYAILCIEILYFFYLGSYVNAYKNNTYSCCSGDSRVASHDTQYGDGHG